MQKTIGFIGLGIMGQPMAHNLIQAGFKVYGFDVSPQSRETAEIKGVKTFTSASEVAQHSDIVITMLPTNKIVSDVITGENGLIHHLKPESIIIDMSSVTPTVTQSIGQQLAKNNIHLLDAPVSGGQEGAISGKLAIMVGGNEKVFNQALPIFDVLGHSTILVGALGAGVTAKLANQIIVNLNIAAVSEAFILADKAGIDHQKMFEAIRGGLAGSQVLEDKAPRIIASNFVAGGRIDINTKDINNAAQTATDLGLNLPLTTNLLTILNKLNETDHRIEDHSAIYHYYKEESER